MLVGRRNRLLRYLSRTDRAYQALIKKLGLEVIVIRDQVRIAFLQRWRGSGRTSFAISAGSPSPRAVTRSDRPIYNPTVIAFRWQEHIMTKRLWNERSAAA